MLTWSTKGRQSSSKRDFTPKMAIFCYTLTHPLKIVKGIRKFGNNGNLHCSGETVGTPLWPPSTWLLRQPNDTRLAQEEGSKCEVMFLKEGHIKSLIALLENNTFNRYLAHLRHHAYEASINNLTGFISQPWIKWSFSKK